jgi:putative endonuclease
MEHVVYIMYSPGSMRNYTGSTTHLIQRFSSHNVFGKDGTAKYRPWVIVHVEFYGSKKEVLAKERYYKQGAGSRKKQKIIQEYLARWAHTLP